MVPSGQSRAGRDSTDPIHRWFRPPRVIGYERATSDGSEPTIVYLRYQGQSVAAAPEQLRYAAEEEILAWDNLAPAGGLRRAPAMARQDGGP